MSEQLKGAFGQRPSNADKIEQDSSAAKMVIMATIGAGQQVLVSDYKFSEAAAGHWATLVLPASQAVWDTLQPQLPPANDKAYFKLIAQFMIDIGTTVLHLNYGFQPGMTGNWSIRTSTLMSNTANAAGNLAKKRPLKPKVNRDGQ